jgi:hypothetical protein
VPIPTKAPVYNGMIAPRYSWMMPPPCNEMIPPGRRAVGRRSFLSLPGFGSSRFELFAASAPEALTGELDAVRIVHEAVENGVRVDGIAEHARPFRRRRDWW